MLRRHLVPAVTLLAVSAVLSVPAVAAERPVQDTVPAEKGPFSVVLEFPGTFDAPDAVEVAYRPEAYNGVLEVVEAVQPGPVTEGQCLVRFDTKKIDEQLEQAELELRIARTNLERLSEEAKRKKESAAIALKTAQMAFERAQQTLENYRDVLHPIRIKEAELSLQSSKDRMAEQEEQYVQLRKMYDADDLVEETEEIVLRRSKRSLDQARERFQGTLARHELTMTVDIPRELEGHEFALRRATNDWELAQATSRLGLDQSRSEFEKARMALARQERSFVELQADREALVVCAPAAGLAVPGQLVKGKWTRLTENARLLKAGQKASANQVLFTIVQAGPSMVRTSIPEASVLDVKPGQAAIVAPAATPNETLSAKVAHVARVSGDGNHDAWLKIETPDARLLAGNTCTITLTTQEVADAITVPDSAVSKHNGTCVVHVWKDGESEAREVQVGASCKGRTVVRSGLEAGELVLQKAPNQ